MSGKSNHLDALTGIRGFAAWYVVFYHIRTGFAHVLPDGVMAFLAKGYLAVDLFFVLSGFVMWLNYGARFADQGLSASRDFWLRRIARIYPLHAFVLLGTLAYVLVLNAAGKDTAAGYPLAELPLHVLLMQNWGLTGALSWNHPAWSISTEMAAYILLPVLAMGINRFVWRVKTMVFAILLLALLLDLVMKARGAVTIGDDIAGNGLLRCIVSFTIGIFVCKIWQSVAYGRRALWVVCGALLGVTLAWSAGVIGEILAMPLIFAALVLLVAWTSALAGNPFSTRIALYLGDISYSTYLVHFMLWIAFKQVLVDNADRIPLWQGGAFVLLTFIVSTGLYRIIEVPGRNAVQALAKRRILKRASA